MSSVHPRVCGERDIRDVIASRGSSPRVRGTPAVRGISTIVKRRFIPACAGNAVRMPSIRAASARFIPACAGNASRTSAFDGVHTVHPRVCGERSVTREPAMEYVRFIPACAGNAWKRSTSTMRQPVHPRVCGERCPMPDDYAAEIAGSSPRVRGTRTATYVDDCHIAVHPRVCGERSEGRSANRPRSRRFIPACAGNALSRRD